MLLFLLLALVDFSNTPESGIYIVKQPGRKDPCEQLLKMLIGSKRVCIQQRPIIHIDELEYVTDILYDPVIKHNHVDVGFSSSSMTTLKQTVRALPKSQFALVVDDIVICTFTLEEDQATRYLRIGTDLDVKSLMMVHDALKKIQY